MRIVLKKISSYIEKISRGLEQLAAGDLNIAYQKDFLGNFCPVQLVARQVIDFLNEWLTTINQSAEQVAIDASQMAVIG